MNLKEVKHRILSVKGTQKITQAMKLVASAKLRRAQRLIEGMRPYQGKLHGIVSSFICKDDSGFGGFAVEREVKKAVIIAVSSDTSLCGAFNSNVIRLMRNTVEEYRNKGVELEIYPIGQKMYNAVVKTGIPFNNGLEGESKHPSYNNVASVAYSLMEAFKSGSVDEVCIVYTRFASTARHLPVKERLLPFDANRINMENKGAAHDFIVEPSRSELLEVLFPKVIALNLYTALLDSIAAEHAARMIAMQTATDNANDLIAELTLEYNKGRQQAITNELLDIVSGSNN